MLTRCDEHPKHLSALLLHVFFSFQDPPGGGLSPAAIIASYATYPYATHLPLLALEALNAFAILQVSPAVVETLQSQLRCFATTASMPSACYCCAKLQQHADGHMPTAAVVNGKVLNKP